MAAQIDAAHRMPDAYTILPAQASVAMFQGQLMLAKELTAQYASEVTANTGFKGAAANAWSELAQGAALYGDTPSTRAAVRTALDIERNVNSLFNSAFALVAIGDAAESRALVDEARRQPGAEGDEVDRIVKPIDAVSLMRRGDPKAVELMPAPKDNTEISFIWAAGLVHLQVGDPAAAAERFKQVMESNSATTSPLYALAPLYDGRALAKLGRIDGSRQAYDQFFERFKNADASLPVLLAAKQEYRRLKPAT